MTNNILNYSRNEKKYLKDTGAYFDVDDTYQKFIKKEFQDPFVVNHKRVDLCNIFRHSPQNLKKQTITWWEEFCHIDVYYPQVRPYITLQGMTLYYKDNFNYLTCSECENLKDIDILIDCLERVEDEYISFVSIEKVMGDVTKMIETFNGVKRI